MMIKRGDTTFDKILAHHKNPEAFELSKTDQEILDRWRYIFIAMLNHSSKIEIVNALVKQGHSQSQAYADIRNTESLFGDVMKANREFERALFLAGVKDMLKRSIQKGDRKAEGKARDLWGKYGELGKEDDIQFNPAKLENVPIQFSLTKEEIELFRQHTKGGAVNLNLNGPIDVEFEEIPADAESDSD